MYKGNDDDWINVTFENKNSGEKQGTRTGAGEQNPKKHTRYIIVFFKIIIMYKDKIYIKLDFKLGNIIIRMPAEECFSAH
jgi:hypothetical protein